MYELQTVASVLIHARVCVLCDVHTDVHLPWYRCAGQTQVSQLTEGGGLYLLQAGAAARCQLAVSGSLHKSGIVGGTLKYDKRRVRIGSRFMRLYRDFTGTHDMIVSEILCCVSVSCKYQVTGLYSYRKAFELHTAFFFSKKR